MSENIKTTKLNKFGKKSYNKPFTVKPQDDLSDEGISKEAHESDNKISAAHVAVVSKIIEVPETSRSITTFKISYDRLFAEFKDELVQEYAQMRGCYMGEY